MDRLGSRASGGDDLLQNVKSILTILAGFHLLLFLDAMWQVDFCYTWRRDGLSKFYRAEHSPLLPLAVLMSVATMDVITLREPLHDAVVPVLLTLADRILITPYLDTEAYQMALDGFRPGMAEASLILGVCATSALR